MANSAIGLKSPIGLQDTRNVLINGEFNLWQRGTVAEAGFVGYGGIQNFHHADRWKLYGQSSRTGKGSTLPDVQASRVNFDLGDPVGTVNKSKYYLNLYVGNTADLSGTSTVIDDSEPLSGFCGGTGAGNFIGIFQDIEDVRTLSGKSAILSYWAKSDIINQRIGAKLKQCFAGGTVDFDIQGYTGAGHTLDNTWRQYKTEFNVPSVANQTIGTSGDDALQLGIYVHFCTGHGVGAASPALGLTFEFGNAAGASGNVSIAQVQLEQGTNTTEFDKRSKAEEIMDCYRFFQKTYDLDDAPGTSTAVGQGMSCVNKPGSVDAMQHYQFIPAMHSTPTVHLYDHNGNKNKSSHGNGTPDESAQTQIPNTHGVNWGFITTTPPTGVYYAHIVSESELSVTTNT